MKSPPLEWTLHIAFPLLVDYIRDRGEPDGDTLTEVIRDAFRVHTPAGRAAVTVAIAAGAVAFRQHICKEVTW